MAGLVLDFDLVENSVLDCYYEPDVQQRAFALDWDAAADHANGP